MVKASSDASPRWVACRPGFFLPVRVLSRVFRGKYLELLRAAFDQGQLTFPAGSARWPTPALRGVGASLYQKDWVVYSKAPFGGPAQVLKYLARYTHRVAISNSRLLKLEEDR
jgi:Putative transposase.